MAITPCEYIGCSRSTSLTSGKFCTRCAARNFRQSEQGQTYYASASIKEKNYNRNLMRNFGITRLEFDDMVKTQGGVCAIRGCGVSQDLVVDHCHTTKVIRGVLCRQHNAALGKFNDSVKGLQAAMDYLNGV